MTKPPSLAALWPRGRFVALTSTAAFTVDDRSNRSKWVQLIRPINGEFGGVGFDNLRRRCRRGAVVELNLTNEQIRGLLRNTTDYVGTPGDYDPVTGRGDYLDGGVNAFSAVKASALLDSGA
jgi:hypothetical protein